jgi:predicted CoA-substrate-specific enzyme activase
MADFFAGIDIGSTMTKAVILNERILATVIGPTGAEQRRLANKVMEEALHCAGLPFDAITYVVSTGYGRVNVPFADRQFTEITCHARGVSFLFPEALTIIDIGGQDSKAIRIDSQGHPHHFIMNDKCAAGSGRFIEIIADTLGIPLESVGDISLKSTHPATISNLCTIWAQQEVASSLAQGIPVPDLLAGVHRSLADRISRMAQRLRLGKPIALTGGGAKNRGLIFALKEFLDKDLLIPENPLITGALGAALLGRDAFEKARKNNLSLETRARILESVHIL